MLFQFKDIIFAFCTIFTENKFYYRKYLKY